MIQNITDGFPHGSICREEPGIFSKESIFDIGKKSGEELYVSENKVFADIEEGTAVIHLGKNKDELTPYLLDKPILLERGLYFCFTPLIHEAKVRLKYSGELQISHGSVAYLSIYPKFHLDKVYTFLYHNKAPGFCFKGEKHEIWEMTYVAKGSMHHVIDGQEYKLNTGDIMFFAPMQFHRQYADKGVRASYVTISFAMDFQNPSRLSDRVFHATTQMKAIVKKLLQEKEEEDPYSGDLILSYLKELIVQIIRDNKLEDILDSFNDEGKHRIENDIVKQALAFIDQNIEQKPTAAKTAKSIPVSPSYLSALFRQYTGKTIMEYITEQKLNLAKRYLKEGKLSVTEIACRLSYSSIHYFSRQFKEYFGISPSQYSEFLK